MPTVAITIDSENDDAADLDSSDTRVFSARIHLDGREVGKFGATLIDRPGPFHQACDAESQQLQEIGVTLFGSRGQVGRSIHI